MDKTILETYVNEYITIKKEFIKKGGIKCLTNDTELEHIYDKVISIEDNILKIEHVFPTGTSQKILMK